MTTLSTPPFKKFFKNLKKHITLFTALSSNECTSQEFTTLRTVGHLVWHSTECS